MRTPRAQPRNRDRRPAAACRPCDPSARRSSCPNGRADCLQYAVSSAARHSKAVANCSSLSRPNCRRRSATSARSAAISALRDAINSSTSAGRTIPPLIHSLVPPSPTIRISMPFPKHCGIPNSPRLGSYAFSPFSSPPSRTDPGEPRPPTAPAAEIRFFSLSRPLRFSETLSFPKTMSRPSSPRQRFAPSPTRPGQANEPGCDLRIAALGPRRWRPGLETKTERSQRVVEICLPAPLVGCGGKRPLRGNSGTPAVRQPSRSADYRRNSEADVQATGEFDFCSDIPSARNATVEVGNAQRAVIRRRRGERVKSTGPGTEGMRHNRTLMRSLRSPECCRNPAWRPRSSTPRSLADSVAATELKLDCSATIWMGISS